MKSIASKKATRSEKITAIVFFVLFVIIAVISIYPLFWAANNSLKDPDFENVIGFEINDSMEYILQTISETQFSRYPVYDRTIDLPS